ncbi:extracellular solute-binding protein [Streptococcus oralis]|uniref:ABC transporter, substrate-binding protein n=1 Tax=Streptococcus oralis TaxID=1303 RepID=A0A139QR20_STROR|nr:extracellular solute-binding protein [Streptococcus oralis]KXU04978.1 ABC transporter, substrate-binding protein [Streptococcus oralis]
MKKMKVWSTLLATGVALTTLAACSGGSGGSTPAASSEEKADKSQELVIYSNSVSNGRGEWLTEKAKEAGFNIKMVEVPGGSLADRIIAEKNNSVADMVYGINAVDSNKIRDQKLLVQYQPKWLDKIDKSLADKDGYYNPVIVQPLVLIGNPGVDKMPTDWTKLGSEYKGKYAIFALTGGTSRSILASILVRYLDDNGELGVSAEGWKAVQEYVTNAYTLKQGENTIVKMMDKADETQYGMMWGSGALLGQKEHNVEFKVMTPEVGVPFVTEQTMILNTSKKQALAKEFIDWFGQADVQTEYSEKFGSIPANQDAVKELPEATKKFLEQVKPQDIDWDVVGKHLDEWVEKTELEYVQ